MKKTFMIEKRKALGYSLSEMATRCDCSWGLLEALECGEFACTHPHIAASIAKEYGLTVDEYNQIVHKSHHVTKLPKPKPKLKCVGIYDTWRSGRSGEEADL